MHQDYKIQPIKELRDQQVRYAPREKKIEQLDRAEAFYHEIDVEKNYYYKDICFLITEFRPEMYANLSFSGKEVKDDLLRFIDDLADSVPIPLENIEGPTWTIEQLSERFKVSSKTIARWRKVGLISRRFLVQGKKRVGFLNASVERFIADDPARVQRGEGFSQLTAEERKSIISQAKKLSQEGRSPTEVARLLSESSGRGIETIRYTLKAFDEANADEALFPHRNSPLREETKRKIYHEFRKGETVDNIAKHYGRTKGSIYRIIGEYRVQRIMGLPLDYIDNPEFATAKSSRKDAIFTAPITPDSSPTRKPKPISLPQEAIASQNPLAEDDVVGSEVFVETDEHDDSTGLPPYLAGLYEIPLLSSEQEIHLFRKMNYLKYKASKLRETLDVEKPKVHTMTQIEEFYDQAIQTKNEIIGANLRLVVSIAKKHISPITGFFELVSDGNISLMKAVEKFDYSRGNKFSTYATWAIMRHFARSIPDEKKRQERFRPSEVEVFDAAEDFRTSQSLEEKTQAEREELVRRLMEGLSEREQQILASRYGLDTNNEPRTLRQIGDDLDVTKERVRQIELRALAKLRKFAEEERLEIP